MVMGLSGRTLSLGRSVNQLGFSLQAGLVMGVVNTLAAVSICACAMNSVCSRGRSAAIELKKWNSFLL